MEIPQTYQSKDSSLSGECSRFHVRFLPQNLFPLHISVDPRTAVRSEHAFATRSLGMGTRILEPKD